MILNKAIISICDDNIFRADGIKHLFIKLLPLLNMNHDDVLFMHNYEGAIQFSDVYVQVLRPGEQFICKSEYASRKKNSLMVVFFDNPLMETTFGLPSCLSENTLFIERSETITSMMLKLVQAWPEVASREPVDLNCKACQHFTLKKMEKKVINLYFKGFDYGAISKILDITEKHASYQKRSVMQRLNLHSDGDLLVLKKTLIERFNIES